ncbi:hypothetical protein P9144_21935 [Bacillus subtilis]|nr:hypothetical protein [Bacillus subtilis]MEC2294266.1 hypothetical protein [Bacillus subtilis]MEC3665022.1 hypothetical protein [Bacillus subtilis]
MRDIYYCPVDLYKTEIDLPLST